MSIAAIQKKECTACTYLQDSDEGACEIYDLRPDPCREFSCGWLKGAYGQLDRPDLSGLLLVSSFNWCGDGAVVETGKFDLDGAPVMRADPIPIIGVMEAWSGSLSKPSAMGLLDHMSSVALVTLMYPDGRRELLAQNKAWLTRARAFAVAIIEAQASQTQGEKDV